MAIDYAYNFKGGGGSGNQLKFTGALNFASSNWTVEAFIKLPPSFFTNVPTSIDLFGSWSTYAGSRLCFAIAIGSTSTLTNIYPYFWSGGIYPTGGANFPSTNYPAPYNFVANKWYHIAVTRSGSSFYLHVNGTREASGTCTGSMPNPGLWIVNGVIDYATESLTGNIGNISISNHRVVIGTALYTGATYTVPTSTLTAITGTVLLTGTQGVIYDDSANHYPFVNSLTGSETTYVIPTSGPFSDDVVSETLTLSDTTTATLSNEGTLAQRFTSAGVFQTPGTFDETGIYEIVTTDRDYTVEFWWNLPNLSNSAVSDFVVMSQWLSSGKSTQNWQFTLRTKNSGVSGNYWDIGGNSSGYISTAAAATTSYSINTWYHFAMCKIGSTIKFYHNGTLFYTRTNNFQFIDLAYPTEFNAIDFSAYGIGHTNHTAAKISNLRVVKGVGVYTGNFSVPTSPLSRTQSASTNISALSGSETTLLTFQDNTFIDNSVNNWTFITNGGSVTTAYDSGAGAGPFPSTPTYYAQYNVSTTSNYLTLSAAASSFFGFYSVGPVQNTSVATRLTSDGNFAINGEFDETTLSPIGVQFNGTTQYLTVPDNTAFQFGSGAFTIEGWFNASSLGYSNIYSKRAAGYNGILIGPSPYEDGKFIITVANAAGTDWSVNSYHDSADIPYNINQTYHFALTKTSNTVRFFLDGVLKYTATHSTSIGDDGGAVAIGATFNGYLSNIRVVKGTALYTAGFTIPTRPLTAISGTSLLTCHTFTIIDGSTANGGLPFTITNVGGVVVSRAPAASGIAVRKQTVSSYQVYDSIDEVSLAYTITPDKTLVNEGDTVTYTINGPPRTSTLYYTNSEPNYNSYNYSADVLMPLVAADFNGGITYGVTPLTWAGTATATLWSFTGITQSATSGSGTGAVFSIRKNNATTTMGTHGVLTVIPTSSGSGYAVGDTITIPGASLGLTTPTNNLTITVGSDWFGQVVNPTTVTGTGMVSSGTGTANWTCPDGVYRVSVVCVAGGGGGGSGAGATGGGGGALAYNKDIPVIPGTVYPIVVGAGGAATIDGGQSYWDDGTLVKGNGGSSGTNFLLSGPTQGQLLAGFGSYGGQPQFGQASPAQQGGGGGAGGYLSIGGGQDGSGGNGGSGAVGIGSGGAGGGSGFTAYNGGGGGASSGGGAGILDSNGVYLNNSIGNGGGGGGVGLLGISNIGIGGSLLPGSSGTILGQSGQGGSGGAAGGAASATVGGAGGAYGGGGGGGSTTGGAGGAGAARVIWNYPHGFLPSTTALTAVTNTKLLTSQSATITDATGLNTIGNIATVVAGTTIIPFAGTYSNQFNGTTQYLYVPHSQNFVYGATDDFTIEGYLYTSATTINKGLIYKRSASNISGVNFGTSTTTASRFTLKVANEDGSAWTVNDETAGTFAISTWYHFAITKTNGVIYLYINGLMIRQYAHTTAIYDDGFSLNIGQDPGGAKWVGYLSNIRIIKGTALYYPPSTIVKRNYPDYPFVVDNKGSIPISGGTGTLALTVGQDILQEGVQSIKLQLRSSSTSGTVLATAPTVVVADTSRPLALPGGGQCWCAYPDYVSGPNLVYTGTPGVFTFTAPKGYTAVSAVAIGAGGGGGDNGGGGGGGGALSYSASIAVTAGTTYTITCGAPGTYGGTSTAGGASSFASTIIANGGQPGGTFASPTGGAGGTVGAGTGFAGGAGGAGKGTYSGGGGGGAGGYTAAGGAGGAVTGTYPTLTAASGVSSATGGAGGGGGGSSTAGAYTAQGGGGGGTSPFGSVAVASIAGIAYAGTQGSPGQGGGGSGGVATTTAFGVQLGERGYTGIPYPNGAKQPPNGGRFGGGGGGGDGGASPGGNGGPGCVRIIWGTGRAYPATLTADRVSGFPAAVGNPAGQQ